MTPTTSARASADVDLPALRAFLDDAYGPQFSDAAFEHALGGVHVLMSEGNELVAHAAIVLRHLLHRGRLLRTGYVEAVAVRPDRRRAGLGDRLLTEVERLVRGGYEIGALASSQMAQDIYARRGWLRWTGPPSACTPDGIVPTADDAIFVLPVSVELDVTAALTCGWRDGSPW